MTGARTLDLRPNRSG